MKFKDFFLKKEKKDVINEEELFFEIVKIRIPSLKSFIAWLILKNIIKPYVKEFKHSKPKPFEKLSSSEKINYLVKNVKNLEELATYFTNTFKKIN
ncbi:MAG: hypothetical protein NZZ41_04825 [Candidatus Dojkabacteria bacterium]|nr:hypothetical protein [Candidatus Dojkabacteria bacterium]